jgi:hypothetical protein
MSKELYLNKKNIERGPINNSIDINLIKDIDKLKMVVQSMIKDEVITKASIIEGLIRHAKTSKEEAIQIDEISYTYEELLSMNNKFEKLSEEFYKHCITMISDYAFINEQISCYQDVDNEIEGARQLDKYLIQEILRDIIVSFERNNESIDIMNVTKTYKLDFEKNILNKIDLAGQYVYGAHDYGCKGKGKCEGVFIKKYLDEVAQKYNLESDEIRETYMLKFIIEEFSTKEYEKNGVYFVDQIFEYSTLNNKFQEELKKAFEKFIKIRKSLL